MIDCVLVVICVLRYLVIELVSFVNNVCSVVGFVNVIFLIFVNVLFDLFLIM